MGGGWLYIGHDAGLGATRFAKPGARACREDALHISGVDCHLVSPHLRAAGHVRSCRLHWLGRDGRAFSIGERLGSGALRGLPDFDGLGVCRPAWQPTLNCLFGVGPGAAAVSEVSEA